VSSIATLHRRAGRAQSVVASTMKISDRQIDGEGVAPRLLGTAAAPMIGTRRGEGHMRRVGYPSSDAPEGMRGRRPRFVLGDQDRCACR
jgi:hypothetical protein